MSITLDGVKFVHKPKKGIVLLMLLSLLEFVFSVLLMIALSANIWMPEKAQAEVGIAKVLSYQGRLTDANGNPLGGSGATYYFCFSIWDDPNVGSGNKLWPSGTPNQTAVTVTNGIFNAEIGSADDLSTFNFYSSDTVYLQVEVSASSGTCGQSPFEALNPRQRIAAVGYARATRDVYGDLLRTRNDADPKRVQIGTGAGASTPIYFSLDVKNNQAETIGSTGCSSIMGAGSIWYNSQNGRALVCENNVLKAVGNASEIVAFKENSATEAITSGTVVFAAGNNITLSQQTGVGGGTITISAGGGGGGGGIGGIGAGTQTATSGTVIFQNANNITFGMQGQTITASAAPGQGIAGIAASNTTYTSGTVIISGGPNITVGTDANQKITISAPGQSQQTQNIVRGVVIGGNTSGATASITSGTMTLAGGNNITLSQNGNAITISAGGGGGIGGIAVSNSTTYTSGTVVLAAGPNITLSTDGQTINISGAGGGGGGGYALYDFANLSWRAFISNITNMTAISQRPIFVPFVLPGSLSWNVGAIEVSRAASGSNLFTAQFGIYTFVNSTQISLLGSLQNTYSATDTASVSGIRRILFTGAPSEITALTPGLYVMGMYFSASAGTASMNYSLRGGQTVGPPVGAILPGENQNITATSQLSTMPIARFLGRYTATTSRLPSSVALSQLQQWTSNYPIYFHIYST